MTVENTEVTQDETDGFVITSSDLPEVETEAQEEQAEEEPANSETDATEADDESTSEEQDELGEDTAANTDKAEKQNGVNKRISKLVKQREEANRKAEALERENEELKKAQERKKDKGKDNTKEPVESDFETYDQYLDAVDAYENDQGKEAESKDDNTETKEEATSDSGLTDQQKTALAVLQENLENSEKPEDFESVAFAEDVHVTPEMIEALAEVKNPASILYHLGKNKDIAEDIAGKTPAQQMLAIARLETTVTSKPPKPTKTTKAPDPINPVKGSDAQQKPVSEMSFKEYEEHMNKLDNQRGSSW